MSQVISSLNSFGSGDAALVKLNASDQTPHASGDMFHKVIQHALKLHGDI